MLLRTSSLLLISVISACATYISDYQERLVRSLPNQREVSFNNTQTYPGKILCGNYTTLTADGWNMRSGDFVVGPSFVLSRPTSDEVFVYCSKDPVEALYSRLGIEASDGNWEFLSKMHDDMFAIDQAITRYYNTANTLPNTLRALLTGDFGVGEANLIDPWGQPYHYVGGLSGRTVPQYQLASLGEDGKEGGEGASADVRKEHTRMLNHVLSVVGH